MSAYSWMRETPIYLDFGVEVVAGLGLLFDRSLCCLEGVRELVIRIDTSFLDMSTSVHVERDVREQAELTLGYVSPSHSCQRSRTVLR